MAYRRFRYIGVDKVKMDFAFFAIAFNIKKMVAKMTKGGIFSYLRAYLTHITPYKLFIRLFLQKNKNSLYIHTRTYNEFLVIYIGSFDTPSPIVSVRRPIGFRSPSNRIPSAVRLDSVRCTTIEA